MMHVLFNPSWYRVAELTPSIRNHSDIHRHIYRGDIQYVLVNNSTGQSYRFSPMVYRLIGMMDGRRTVHDIWEKAIEQYGDAAPDQHQVIQLLSQLYSANMLLCNIKPDIARLLQQNRKEEAKADKKLQGNVLFFRVPLADPERFLAACLPAVSALFSIPFLLLALLLIAGAALQLWLNWQEFTTDLLPKILTLHNVFLLLVIYPVMKGLHELSHGFAIKKWGGEVHEMGLMLLILMPLPYIDATSAATFRSKWQRVAVGGAGIYVELLLAAAAVFFWVYLEPGLARTVAYNVIFIGGVSTLFFNGNPLVKFDGYYILSDLLEIPNLGGRSLQYLGYLVNRYLLGMKDVQIPAVGDGERFWLVVYGICSFCYRLCLAVVIILGVAGKFLIVGIVLAIFGCWAMLAAPLMRMMRSFLNNPIYDGKRTPVAARIGAILALTLVLTVLLPLPHLGVSEGVLWLPEEAYLRPGANGVVHRIVAQPGSQVQPGDILIECRDPLLETHYAVQSSQLREYRLRYNAALPTDQTEARIIKEQIGSLEQAVARYQEQLREMTITSKVSGTFILPYSADLPEKYIKKGELLGYILSPSATVRIAVKQQDVDLIRTGKTGVEIRNPAEPTQTWHGKILRELLGTTDTLPSEILGTEGGGTILTDPAKTGGSTPLETVFLFDILLTEPMGIDAVGKRLFVRFDYGQEPIFFRLYRTVRQLFLKRFHV